MKVSAAVMTGKTVYRSKTYSWSVLSIAVATCALVLHLGCCSSNEGHEVGAAAEKWQEELLRIVWVAYSPPSADPGKGVEPTPTAISEDLAVLRKAGFTGLVTYGSSGLLGRELPALAQSQGFQGLIPGIWNPSNQEEISAAEAAAKNPIVLGFCVGNEGLRHRYQLLELSAAVEGLRKKTGKPVTTTEIIEEYSDENLLRLGDWVFPNAHPFFHNQLDPERAVGWTKAAFDDLKRRADRPVIFKEVGLPTAGDPQGRLSEAAQEQYYVGLAKTDVKFVYFEGFDQPWKTHLPIEPHWGIFQADRTPKVLAKRLMENATGSKLAAAPSVTPFYVYMDADSPENHYKPTGYMGDIGDIHIDEAFARNPHSGKTCIRVVYDAKGSGPNGCDYAPPCKWAGVYWQEPPNNWGKQAFWKGKGFDLSRYNCLVFWARAEKDCMIEFKVGGIGEAYGDSLSYPRTKRASLKKEWQEFEIDLSGADLKHIIGGSCFATNWDTNPNGATFYLDDIRFEHR
jgi:exo-beta-1,3-glucanase (GH17 family)